jgi:hypothetical protein
MVAPKINSLTPMLRNNSIHQTPHPFHRFPSTKYQTSSIVATAVP